MIELSKESFEESQSTKWLRRCKLVFSVLEGSTASQIHTHSNNLTADYPTDYLEQIFALGQDRHPPHTQCHYQFDRDKKNVFPQTNKCQLSFTTLFYVALRRISLGLVPESVK